jgi:tetratricopeptide (TPR) repeat protein
MIVAATLVVLVLGQAPKQGGQEHLIDAQGVIRELGAKDQAAALAASESAFCDDIRQYLAGSGRMPARVAAKRWLDLVERGQAIPRRGMYNGSPQPIGSIKTVMCALPRPGVWPEIVKIVANRPATRQNKVLLLLFARLTGDDPGVTRICKEFLAPSTSDDSYAKWLAPRIEEAVRMRHTSVFKRRAALDKKLALNEEGADYSDVTSRLSPKEARRVLLRLLQRATDPVTLSGSARLLAQEVAIANAGQIKRPPWSLFVDMPDAAALEKLVGHYGVSKLFEAGEQEREAKNVFLGMLIDRGDIDQAASLIQRHPFTPYLHFQSYCHTHKTFATRLFNGLAELQKKLPDIDFWYAYAIAAKESGQAAQAAQYIAGIVSDPTAKPDLRRALVGHLLGLHAFMGDLEAVRRDYEVENGLPPPTVQQYPADLSLKAFALATGDKEALEKWITLQRKDPEWRPGDVDLLDALAARGRFSDAEALLWQGLRNQVKQGRGTVEGNNYGYLFARLYYLAKQPLEVIRLLRDYPYWETADLRDLPTYSSSPSVAFYAAWAFARTGKRALAIETIERTLLQTNNSEELYKLLNNLGGGDTIAFYDGLHRVYPDQPPPLIWKAALLQRLGRLREAEWSVREAIRIDPTGAARRYKAYNVLAQILRSKGDRRGAAACEARVRAAALADRGDSLKSIGFSPQQINFYPQAIAAYRESIEVSPTDYRCEESLAECLDAIGKRAEAVVHCHRAFELMPRGVGPYTDTPIEWGSILSEPEMAIMGLRILAGAVKTTHSAAAAFLMGDLDEHLDRAKEAVENYRTAVRLDPKFCIAWQTLAIFHQDLLEPNESEKVNYAILALHPNSEGKFGCHFEMIRDLTVVYKRLESTLRERPVFRDTPLFPMHTTISPAWPRRDFLWLGRDSGFGSPPGAFLAEAEDVDQILSLYSDHWEDR